MRAYLSALLLLCSTIVSAANLNKIVVFGDSLSDKGNLYAYMNHQFPVSPPYYKGRFSNGPVWIEILSESYFPGMVKEHLLDYAFAGASVKDDGNDDEDGALFTLRSEIDSYLFSHQDRADANTLYVVWIGSNDYLATPENVEEETNNVNDTIKANLQRLVDKGAKHFLVLNLPDLGTIPAAREFDSETLLSALAKRHNALLKDNLESLKAKNPDVQWMFFDVENSLNDMLMNPARNGFTNVTGTCNESALEEPSSQSMLKVASSIKLTAKPNVCDGFLFFDLVHPTGQAHSILAERVRTVLEDAHIHFVN